MCPQVVVFLSEGTPDHRLRSSSGKVPQQWLLPLLSSPFLISPHPRPVSPRDGLEAAHYWEGVHYPAMSGLEAARTSRTSVPPYSLRPPALPYSLRPHALSLYSTSSRSLSLSTSSRCLRSPAVYVLPLSAARPGRPWTRTRSKLKRMMQQWQQSIVASTASACDRGRWSMVPSSSSVCARVRSPSA